MKKTILMMALCAVTFVLSAQSFYYKSNLPVGVEINDAVELNGKFYLVGNIDSSGTEMPYFCTLNNSGTLIFDTIFNSDGKFVNIHEVNNTLHISQLVNPIPGFEIILDMQYDSNFVFQNGVFIGEAILQKSKLVGDSVILYIGYEPPPFSNATYTSFVAKQHISSGNVLYNYISYSINPIEAYDIISSASGKYHLYLNSPDSTIKDQVSVFYLNDSLQPYKNLQLHSSYRAFGSDSTIRGVVAVEYNVGTINMNYIANHPTYANQLNNKDLALIRFDTNYNELSISFSGKTDTNYTTSRNSLAMGNGAVFTGGSGSNEIILNQNDTAGNHVKSAFYVDGTLLELKKIISFNDSLLIIGNTDDQFFAIKIDSVSHQLITSIYEENKLQVTPLKIFPNPTRNFIVVDNKGLDIQKYQIYNQQGHLIKEYGKETSSTLNIEDLKSGIYILTITTKLNQRQSVVFIKT